MRITSAFSPQGSLLSLHCAQFLARLYALCMARRSDRKEPSVQDFELYRLLLSSVRPLAVDHVELSVKDQRVTLYAWHTDAPLWPQPGVWERAPRP
jgi:hypothetical protein